jgi:hypothetical protein
MKPIIQFAESGTRRDSSALALARTGHPITHHAFRPNSHADFAGRCHGSPSPSFRRISNDYFNNEARGHFVSEAIVFGLMIVTAAVPVIEGARVAGDLLRSLGLL